jgi:hypothetical protein
MLGKLKSEINTIPFISKNKPAMKIIVAGIKLNIPEIKNKIPITTSKIPSVLIIIKNCLV